MTQHAALTPERWARFAVDQQILMIGNEMNRGGRLSGTAAVASLRACYERVLRLTDLTVEVNAARPLRRELLRWREVVAALYLGADDGLDPAAHRAAFRVLLQLRPFAAKQIPLLLGR